MELVYPPIVKRVVFQPSDSKRLAELREVLQKQCTHRLTDNETIRQALILAHSMMLAAPEKVGQHGK